MLKQVMGGVKKNKYQWTSDINWQGKLWLGFEATARPTRAEEAAAGRGYFYS
jgi:hypothetical protein